MDLKKIFVLMFVVVSVVLTSGCITTDTPVPEEGMTTITDAFDRTITIPENPQKIAVVGSGSLRYFMYLGLPSELFVVVDFQDSNAHPNPDDVRPYGLAHPELKEIDAIGSSRGTVDNERLLLSGADVLFMAGTSSSNVEIANEIQEKTGVPVVMFYTGNYVTDSDKIRESLMMIASIFHVEDRAIDVLAYFDTLEMDLKDRAARSSGEKPTVYVAGISYAGSNGIEGTNPDFYPFEVLSANNVAGSIVQNTSTGYARIAKEKLLEWDPEIIFVDLSTLRPAQGGAIEQMETDPSYKELKAVKNGNIYTINPETTMGANHETTLANAYFIGTILYPEEFADINPIEKANEIYSYVVGAPVFEQLKENSNGLSYQRLDF